MTKGRALSWWSIDTGRTGLLVGVAGLAVGLIGVGLTIWFGTGSAPEDEQSLEEAGLTQPSLDVPSTSSAELDGAVQAKDEPASPEVPGRAAESDSAERAMGEPTPTMTTAASPTTSSLRSTTISSSTSTTTSRPTTSTTTPTTESSEVAQAVLEVATSFTPAAGETVASNSVVEGEPVFCFDFYVRAPYAGVFGIKHDLESNTELGDPVAPPGEQDYDQFVTPPSDQAVGIRDWKQRLCWGVPTPHTSVRLAARAYDTRNGATVDTITLERFVSDGSQYPSAPCPRTFVC